MQINVNRQKKCGICKNWYDPTNAAISPKNPTIGIWELDFHAIKPCLKRNTNEKATGICRFFERKDF